MSKLCKQCGASFSRPITPYGYRKAKFAKRKFCSRVCGNRHNNRIRIGIPRSEETKRKIREARAMQTNGPSGKNHWNWKGGVTSLTRRIQGLAKYRAWRSAVYERDGFTCQGCGKRGEKLNADHIKPLCLILHDERIKTVQDAVASDALWDVKNGRTLCVPCHKKTPTYAVNARWIVKRARHTTQRQLVNI